MTKSKKLVFFGNERLATAVTTKTPVFRGLLDAGYEINAVITNYSEATSRNKRSLEIAEIARSNHIPVLMPESLFSIEDKLKSYGAEAAVLVAYGKIIPANIIGLFPKGIVNLHPSLLPKYRGPTPLETAILEGAKTTGVSIMQLSAKMDAGPIYDQAKINLSGHETKQELADKLLELGSQKLIEKLPQILDGSLKPEEQKDNLATYTKLINKEDGILDFSKPAESLEREVRAFYGWPKSVTRIFGHKIIVTKAGALDEKPQAGLAMKANPGWLEIVELIAPSGKTMSGTDFIRGHEDR